MAPTNETTKVFIVDDSLATRKLLTAILNAAPDIVVIGEAASGAEALSAIKSVKPDVITMDIQMPQMNGLEVTRQIMETNPIPIVVVSTSCKANDMEKTFAIIEAGAVAAVEKPTGPADERHAELARALVRAVKDVHGVKLVRRWPAHSLPQPKQSVEPAVPEQNGESIKVVVMGASTGGPQVISSILKLLPVDFPVPILIVQHIANGFLGGLVDWLNRVSPLEVRIAVHGQRAQPGKVYFGQENRHFGITSNLVFQLKEVAAETKGTHPTVSYLFKSAADVCGSQSLGVLMTGMGVDGAQELKLLKDLGALTIVQDEKSCAVPGMPKEALRLGAARMVLSPPEIATAIKTAVLKGSQSTRTSTIN